MIERSVQKKLVRLLGGAFETERHRIVLTDTAMLMRAKGEGEDIEIPYDTIEGLVASDGGLEVRTKENVIKC